MKTKLNLLFILFTFSGLFANAQTGPGGIGNPSGASSQPELAMWLDASSLSLSNGDGVDVWNDLSGNANNATQATVASRPTFTTGQINGLPAIVFDGTDDFLPFDGTQIVGTDYTVIFVARRNSNRWQRIFVGGTEEAFNKNLHLCWRNGDKFKFAQRGNDFEAATVLSSEPYSSGTGVGEFGIFSALLSASETSAQRRAYQNNHLLGSRDNSSYLADYQGAAIARIVESGTSVYHDVDAAEVIIYKTALNDAQLQIVHEYLQSKYGIVIENDLYTPSTGYETDLTGVGEASNGEHGLSTSAGLYLEALSGVNDGDYVFVSHNDAANSSADFTTADLPIGVENRYNRLWQLKKINTPAVRIAFDFDEAVSDGQNPTNATDYVLLYRSGTSGSFAVVKQADGIQNDNQVYFDLADTDIANGYYTLATQDEAVSPLAGAAGKIWYSLVSGDWDDPAIWTLDPSGALPNNPNNYTPTTSPTATSDKVFVLSGKTVEVQTDKKENAEITVNGRLELNATKQHSFGKINGKGRIIMQGDNFPSGDATHFSSAGMGEGTAVYEGGSYDLATAHVFFDVEINLSATSNVLVLTKDYVINGNLTIETGKLQINDASNDQRISIDIEGDLWVQHDGAIGVGTGNPFYSAGYQIGTKLPSADGIAYHDIYHQLSIAGDFINDGTVRFTNLTAPNYNTLATDGAVTVTFTGASNKKVTLNSQTDFYNLVVDKGVNRNYILTLYSNNQSYFTLFGANSVYRNQSLGYSSENPQVRKALFIKNGTLKLTGNIYIPTLTEGGDGQGGGDGGNGDYAIGKNAGLWVAGSNVQVFCTADDLSEITGYTSTASGLAATDYSNQALSLFGEFRISDGFFGTRSSGGFVFWASSNPQVKIEGGDVNVSQFRDGGSGGVPSYIQTGGTFTVRGNETQTGFVGADYPLFQIANSSGIFNMSGGEIVINDVGGSNTTTNGIYVPTQEGNYNVTGGKLTVEVAGGQLFEIGMNAPVWDFEVKRLSGSGDVTVRLTNDFKVLDDFTINENCVFDVEDDNDNAIYDLYVNDDFRVYNTGNYLAHTNTTYLQGRSNSSNIQVDGSTAGKLKFYNLHIEKEANWSATTFDKVQVNGVSHAGEDHPVEIRNDLTIVRGDFYTADEAVHVKGNITISEGKITNATGKIVLNGSAVQTLTGSPTEQLDFGRYELDNEYGAMLASNINVTDFELTPNSGKSILDLGTFNLTVTGDLTTNGTFSNTVMFQTAGNASDGGITHYIDGNGTYDYPIGTNANAVVRYTPVSALISDFVDDGYLRVSTADDYLATTIDPGSNSLTYYWRMRHSDFTTVPSAVYSFIAADSDDPVNSSDGKISIPSKTVGEVLDEGTFLRSEVDGAVSNSNMSFYTNTRSVANASYTVGKNTCFNGTLKIFYNRVAGGSWFSKSTWSNDSHSGSAVTGNGEGKAYPGPGDIVRISGRKEDGTTDIDNVTIDADGAVCAGLIFESFGGALNSLYINGNNASVLSVDLGDVSGEKGRIHVRVDGNRASQVQLNGDYGDFAAEASNEFVFINNSNSEVELPSQISEFPMLRLSHTGGNPAANVFTFPMDITVNNRMMVNGYFRMDNDYTQNDGTFQVTADGTWAAARTGHLIFPTDGSRTVIINGDLHVSWDGQIRMEQNNTGSDVVHNLSVSGDINLFSTSTQGINLYNNTGTNLNAANLNVYGDKDADFTNLGSGSADLYRIVMDKAGTGMVTFDFQDAITVNGPTDGDPKAIELISGRLGLRDSGIDVTLSSGGSDFKIPAGCQLWLGSQTTARVSGNNTGIWLDGQLVLGNGVDALFNEGNNNYIEYTASGESSLKLNSGNAELYVGSQIRRATDTEEGILDFQLKSSSATVMVGTDGGFVPENDRGVFEILNASSNFEMVSGATFVIANAQDNPEFPSFYLSPETYSIESGSVIQIGNADTQASQIMGIYSDVALPNVHINNASANDPIAELWYQDLTIGEDLDIASGTTFDCETWNLTVNGDFTNAGTYVPDGNTTYFSGSTAQAITGNTTFYNFTKTTSNTLSLNNPITISNALDIQDGTLADGGNTITLLGNLNNAGIHEWGGSGYGIYFNGTSQQEATSTGIFGKITIENSEGVYFPTEAASIQIEDEVELRQGILNIGRNLLVLSENAVFVEGSAYGETNMVQTNLSFTDNGIKKNFADAFSGDFVYPIGSEGKYTPVELSISATSAGSIRLKAANEIHATIQEDDEPCNEIVDQDNALYYYWILNAETISSFSGTATMHYYSDDLKVTAPYTAADYIPAKLLKNSDLWNKFSQSDFDEANDEMTFTFSATDYEGINGTYTAGVEDPTCKGAIPDKVSAFISIADGLWTDETKWDTYPTSGGTVPVGGPAGAIVIIDTDHKITVPSNGVNSYQTTIRGVLDVGTTFGHRLGDVDGVGELYVERGELPAAIYDEFVLPNTGTFHFGGSDDYDILSEMPQINNLKLSGTGERRMANLDLHMYGDLQVDGTGTEPQLINEHDRTLRTEGNITFNAGSFDAGVGDDALVEMIGSNPQVIYGDLTNNSAFNHLKINNPQGVSLISTVEVAGKLIFENGMLNTSTTDVLRLSDPATDVVENASSSHFVNGPLQKYIETDGEFEFPVGDASRYGRMAVQSTTNSPAGYWEVQYYNQNPLYDSAPKNPEAFTGNINFVSHNEYWRVKAPSSCTGSVQLFWNAQSGVPDASDPDQDETRIVQWNSPTSAVWNELGTTLNNGNESLTTSSSASFNLDGGLGNYFAIGSRAVTTLIWQGDESTAWEIPGNWNLGRIPAANSNVLVPTTPTGTYGWPVISSQASCFALDVETGAELSVGAGSTLTANGDITINGTLTLSANSGGTGQLMNSGSITGAGAGIAYFPVLQNRYAMISSPLSSASAATVNTYNGHTGLNFYWYDETHDEGSGGDFRDGWTEVSGNLNVAQGYAIAWAKGSRNIEFTGGLFNTGELTIGVGNKNLVDRASNGWNLIGNPYPSNLDAKKFVQDNAGLISGALYFWDDDNSLGVDFTSADYATWNLAGYVGAASTGGGTGKIPNGIVPVGQGFFVERTLPGNATLSFSNPMRTLSSGVIFNKKDEEEIKRIWLELDNSEYRTQLLIAQTAVASDGYDPMYDARKISTNSSISFYSHLAGRKFAIQSIGEFEELDEIKEVAIGIETVVTGTVKIKTASIEKFDDFTYIYLKDKKLNTLTDLKNEGEYSFWAESNSVKDRFSLLFSQEPLSNLVSTSAQNAIIYARRNQVIVTLNSPETPSGQIIVSSVLGKVVKVEQLGADYQYVIDVPSKSGVYTVKVINNRKVTSEKVFILN